MGSCHLRWIVCLLISNHLRTILRRFMDLAHWKTVQCIMLLTVINLTLEQVCVRLDSSLLLSGTLKDARSFVAHREKFGICRKLGWLCCLQLVGIWQAEAIKKPSGDTYANKAGANADSRLEKALPQSQLMAPRMALYLSLIINHIILFFSQSFPYSLYLFGFWKIDFCTMAVLYFPLKWNYLFISFLNPLTLVPCQSFTSFITVSSQDSLCLLIISPELLFPTMKMLPEEATFPGTRISVEDKAIVFLEQIKFLSI